MWSVILREECRLRVLRKIFALKRGEVIGDWRKLRNEELHDLHCSLNIIWAIKSRIMQWVAYVARTGENRNAYMVLVGKAEGKTPLEKTHMQMGG